MKKLLVATVAMAGLTALAALESENIVGYQTVALPANGQYALLTPTFTSVDSDGVIDLTEIAVVKPGSDTFTSKKKILVQKMDLSSGAMTAIYSYTTAGNKWVDQSNADVVPGAVTFAPGESMCVRNGDTKTISISFPSPVGE